MLVAMRENVNRIHAGLKQYTQNITKAWTISKYHITRLAISDYTKSVDKVLKKCKRL